MTKSWRAPVIQLLGGRMVDGWNEGRIPRWLCWDDDFGTALMSLFSLRQQLSKEADAPIFLELYKDGQGGQIGRKNFDTAYLRNGLAPPAAAMALIQTVPYASYRTLRPLSHQPTYNVM